MDKERTSAKLLRSVPTLFGKPEVKRNSNVSPKKKKRK